LVGRASDPASQDRDVGLPALGNTNLRAIQMTIRPDINATTWRLLRSGFDP
jgi:hypothetical protein